MTLSLPAMCPLKTCPCVRSKRPRVYRHHAHMCFNMCAWCRYTRGRFEHTHGHVLNGHTGFFSVPHNTHYTPHRTHTTTQDTTQHNNTTTPPLGDRERQRQRKKTGTESEEKTAEERQKKKKTKEDKTRQDRKRRDKTRMRREERR